MCKIVIITSNHLRHKFFVNTLASHYEVLGVVSETKRPNQSSEEDEKNEILSQHFLLRDEAEKKYFGSNQEFNLDGGVVLEVNNGESNSEMVFEWVKDKNPDFVILFGSSIIKEPLLSFYHDRIINIHLGLSPYYRGSGTNFWPLVNYQPECVGATIHLAVLKVDAGSILAQVRPNNLQASDDSHDMGCRTIIAGAEKMAECIKKYHDKSVTPKVQDLSRGSVFKRADFNAEAVVKMQENFKQGMLEKYLAEKEKRDSLYPIINL